MNKIKNRIGYLSLLLSATLLVVGCGSSSSGPSKNSGTGSIDLAKYFPSKDMSKSYYNIEGNESKTTPSVKNETITIETIKEISTITTITDDGEVEKIIISDQNISQISEALNFSGYRHVNIGDTFFKIQKEYTQDFNQSGTNYAKLTKKLNLECTIAEQKKGFSRGEGIENHTFTGDILKVVCIDNGEMIIDINPVLFNIDNTLSNTLKDINGTHPDYNIRDLYFKKGIGQIASIDDDCLLGSNTFSWNDDREKSCKEKHFEYEYYIEQ